MEISRHNLDLCITYVFTWNKGNFDILLPLAISHQTFQVKKSYAENVQSRILQEKTHNLKKKKKRV